jgi:hypothetical protein
MASPILIRLASVRIGQRAGEVTPGASLAGELLQFLPS